ncbi:hypothetical protein H5410_001634 [Solanum commersonii]|uniref:Uncharacterized protein n=1 Tax=Solanum commersonii TaxID=4109 RepID=A0A9J6AZB5_SOLCO|nr:hypothetical protein H5410_001634 [Solanum commersonii]
MQVYKGLEIVTNKITHAEKQVVRVYLLGIHIRKRHFLFQLHARKFLSEVHCLHRIFFEDLMCSNYCWRQSILNRRVDTRVDEMVNVGLVDEVRQIFIPDADYTNII